SFSRLPMTLSDPIAAWHDLLQAERGRELCAEITASQRARRLRFGDRVLCPFLRPFFLTGDDEARVTRVAELLWTLGARVGRAAPPRIAIVDWREVPTYSEFELLRDAFTAAGVPTIVCDPRDLQYSSSGLHAGGARIDLVYRRVLINDMVARPDECRALLQAYEARAVCVANTLRCKMAHKKAFFAVLTGERYAELFSEAE